MSDLPVAKGLWSAWGIGVQVHVHRCRYQTLGWWTGSLAAPGWILLVHGALECRQARGRSIVSHGESTTRGKTQFSLTCVLNRPPSFLQSPCWINFVRPSRSLMGSSTASNLKASLKTMTRPVDRLSRKNKGYTSSACNVDVASFALKSEKKWSRNRMLGKREGQNQKKASDDRLVRWQSVTTKDSTRLYSVGVAVDSQL